MTSLRPDQPRGKVRATTRADLLATIPYLLGHHPDPAGDLVVLGLHGTRVVVHARAGLDTPGGVDIDGILNLVAREPHLDGTIVVGYGPPQREPAITAMATAFTGAGVPVHDVLRVAGGRYFCLVCHCVPAAGMPFDPTSTSAAAQATMAGLVAMPTRDAVAARVAHRPDTAVSIRTALAPAADRLLALRPDIRAATAILDTLLRQAEPAGRLDDDAAATVILLLRNDRCRDHLWLTAEDLPWQLELWCDLTRRCPPEHVAPVACLAAWSAWRLGDPVTARAALARVASAGPRSRMADLLTSVLDHHISPATLPWPPSDGQRHQPIRPAMD